MRRAALPLSLALLLLSLLLLYAGRFVQLDDTSGFGSDEWVLPLGYLALLTAVAAVVVSLSERRARQAVGGSLLLLDAVVFFWAGADEGFRFIWQDADGELFLLQLALGLLGLALMTPSFRAPAARGEDAPRQVTGWARTVIYVAALVVLPLLALYFGVLHFEHTECVGTDGDCDLGFLEGIVWATVAVAVVLVGIVVAEVTIRVRRRRVRTLSHR